MADFNVPQKPEDLLEGGGNFYSAEDIALSEALAQFDDVVDCLCDQSTSIVDNFDVLLSLIRNYGELSDGIKSRVLDVLMSGASCLTAHVDLLSAPVGEMSIEAVNEVKKARNAVKMHVYLLKLMMHSADKEATEQADAKMPTARGPKGAAAKAAKGAKKGGAMKEMWQWENLRPKLLSNMYNLMQANLERLWSPSKPDERFCSLLTSFAVIAFSSVAGCKDKDSRAQAIKITLSAASRYGQRTNAVTAITDLLHSHEHATGPMAELVASAYESGDNALVDEVMTEVGNIPLAELARDSGASKCVSSFISDLSDLAPMTIMMHMEDVSPHLQQGDSYLMRNAILHAYGRVLVEIAKILRTERSETALQTRELIISILKERALDVNAFTRSKALQVWAYMCENDAIPKKTQPAVVTLASVRLEDKSAQVRKSAIQLLKLLVQKNPYAHTLPLSVFKSKLEDAQKQLAEAEEAALASVKVEAPEEEGEGDKEIEKEEQEEEKEEGAASADKEEEEEAKKKEEGAKADAALEDMKSRVNFYQAAVQFVSTIHGAVLMIELLLKSKTTSDVVEAIEFLVAAYPFQMEVAQQSIRKMLLLVWSKETSIKDAAADAFRTIFLSPLDTDGGKAMLAMTAKRLCDLVRGANVGELASLEHIMSELAKAKQLPDALLSTLWDMYAAESSIEAATLLTLSASTSPKLFVPRLRTLLSSSALDTVKAHPVLARCTCLIWQRLTTRSSMSQEEADALSHLAASIMMSESASDDDRWLPAAEQAINTLVAIHPSPQAPLANIMRSLVVQVFSRDGSDGGASTCEPWRLARLFHCAGHSSTKLLACIESIAAQQMKEEDMKDVSGKDKDKKKAMKEEEDDLVAAMGPADAAVQENRLELAREVGERDIIEATNLLGMFGPMLRQVCLNDGGKYNDSRLRCASILALCKLMCISSDYCEENLQLLFSLMVAAPEPSIRSNIVVALGDMCFRWTNLTEPWMPHIYALLRDNDVNVRHNTLTVLTHLVLNDMVKVRGQVSEMVLCLEDEDERIVDMAMLFLNEFKLKQQGQLLYNLLPDMVGRLSAAQLEEESFRRMIKYVFAFIDKAKQTDGLVDKFCQRFRSTDNQRQWRDVAFCLSQLTYSEKSVKKLCEEGNLKTFADKLHDDDIYNSFLAIVAKAKKLPKSESKGPEASKNVAEELEGKLAIAREKGISGIQEACEEGGDEADAAQVKAPVPKKKAPARKGRAKAKKESSEEEEEDDDDDDDEEEEEEKVVAKKSAARKAPAKGKGKKAEASSSEGEEEQESDEEDAKENKKSNVAGSKKAAGKAAPASARTGRASTARTRR